MFKKLLNKMKLFKKICVAVFTGNMYTPYVRTAMKEAEEIEKHVEEEKIKYAKGGVVEPFVQKFELDESEVIVPAEAWEKDNQALYMNEEWRRCREAVMAMGVSAHEMATGIINVMHNMQIHTKRQNTNNWRKMHGLPMRRKAGRKK